MTINRKRNSLVNVGILIILISSSLFSANAQVKTPDIIAESFFMPALQMGYINHNSENISSGLIIQTSLDYRTKRGIFFRINYDDFSGRLNLKNATNQTYSARIPISEFIGGLGYRLTRKRNNYFLILQSGIRFYENPVIENTNGNLNIEQKGATTGTMRYTFGYEYELFENVFLNSEIFAGHFYTNKDFWRNSKPYLGITLGVSSRLF
jgi:hypothetical protein